MGLLKSLFKFVPVSVWNKLYKKTQIETGKIFVCLPRDAAEAAQRSGNPMDYMNCSVNLYHEVEVILKLRNFFSWIPKVKKNFKKIGPKYYGTGSTPEFIQYFIDELNYHQPIFKDKNSGNEYSIEFIQNTHEIDKTFDSDENIFDCDEFIAA